MTISDELTSDVSRFSNTNIHDQALLITLLICDSDADKFPGNTIFIFFDMMD